jgi:MoxR-like ATPase
MEKPNFHKIHEERNALRTLNQEGELSTDIEQSVLQASEELHNQFHIKEYGSLTTAKQELRSQREDIKDGLIIDWNAIEASLGKEAFDKLKTIEEKSNTLTTLIASRSKKLREMNGNPKKTELLKTLIHAIGEDVRTKETEYNELKAENQTLFRVKDLLSYREGLFDEGHIAEVPSTQAYLVKIEEAMIEGKSMFLHGPTGTGKTSLAIRAAKKLTGQEPEIVYCNPQTKESNVFGRTGIGIDEKTEKQITQFDPAPLVRAMREGKVVIFDEFTALPKDMMVMLKGIMNAQPGDVRSVTGDGEVVIAPGFQMIFTANLKSEKNNERQDMPPEMANEFAQNNIEVKYQTKDESYDIILARLMEKDGTLTMSEYDMEVTLSKLCEALEEIQRAYTEVIAGDLGEKEGLKKLVFNQRTIENTLSRWHTKQMKGEEGDFVTFLDEQLTIPLTFKEYSEKDRSLTAKILARHGLLATVAPAQLGLPNDAFSFTPDVGMQSVEKSRVCKTYALTEVASLDPFEKRVGTQRADVDVLLGASATEGVSLRDTPSHIEQLLKDIGTPATLDTSFEGGVISLSIDQETIKALQTYDTAIQSYKDADGESASWVYDKLSEYPYMPLTIPSLDVLVLNHGKTTPQQRDTLVTTMDKADYRTLTLAELIALGITHPDLNKRSEVLNTYNPQNLDGVLQTPCLNWGASERNVYAVDASNEWSERLRFLFVRK